jgi:hypothetical protein
VTGQPQRRPQKTAPDDGLRRMLTYTFIALVLAVLFSLFAVSLVTRWFGS